MLFALAFFEKPLYNKRESTPRKIRPKKETVMKEPSAKKLHLPYQHKATAILFLVLRFFVVLVMVRKLFLHEWESVFICVLTLFLFVLPSIASSILKITLPSVLEIIILLFIFSAEILGELNSFYIRIPHWDTMLHTINGFCCAAVGFALVDMLNRNKKFSLKLSPLYLAIAAFCFSMTIGVLWEVFEYSADTFFGKDMQKDTVVSAINSTMLDPTKSNKVVQISDISDVVIVHSDGSEEALGVGGYLDVGINDTMKDLIVNLIGAVVFSVIGYFYVKTKGKGKFAKEFIPQVEPVPPQKAGKESRK